MIQNFCQLVGIVRYGRKYSCFDIDICIRQRVWWPTYVQWQDPCNVIIHLAGCGRPWITGTGVCSNSIECATNTSRSLHWLDSSTVWWVFDVPFAGTVLQPTSPSNPPLPPAATGGRVCELVAMMIASILRPVLQ